MTPDDNKEESPAEKGLQLFSKPESQGLEQQLIRQLNKDLSMCGVNALIDEEFSPGEVVRRLKEILHGLVRDDFQAFLNLLYRVDVPQSKMSRSEDSSFSDYIERSTYELLKREWQKVWIRNRIR